MINALAGAVFFLAFMIGWTINPGLGLFVIALFILYAWERT